MLFKQTKHQTIKYSNSVKGCTHFGWKKLKRRSFFATKIKLCLKYSPVEMIFWRSFFYFAWWYLIFLQSSLEISWLLRVSLSGLFGEWFHSFQLALTVEKWWGHSLLACLPVISYCVMNSRRTIVCEEFFFKGLVSEILLFFGEFRHFLEISVPVYFFWRVTIFTILVPGL